MSKKALRLTITICILLFSQKLLGWDIYSFDKNLFVGNIIFPQNMKDIPQISLYRRGLKIKTETDNASNKIQFTISDDKACNQFYILITKNIRAKVEDNTVHHLTADPNQSKFYRIQIQINGTPRHPLTEKNNGTKAEFAWRITPLTIYESGIIPDNTLIIIFNPDYVDKLEGGNNLELPKIVIKKNILELAGSQEKLLQEADELIMGSVDFLTLSHIKPKPEIKLNPEKKVVMFMPNPSDAA